MSNMKSSFFLVKMNLFMKRKLVIPGTISKFPPLWSPLSQEVSYARVTVVTQRSPERKHLSSSSRGRRDINRNCSKPLETRFELLTKAQKSPDDDLGSNVYGLALGPVVLFSIYEMGNDVWKLKTDYSDLSPSMFSGSGGPSRDGGGGNEEDKMETEEEVMKTYKYHLS